MGKSFEESFHENLEVERAPRDAPMGEEGGAPSVAWVVADVQEDPQAQAQAFTQRERSWEGRLRAREQQLAQREAELDDKLHRLQAHVQQHGSVEEDAEQTSEVLDEAAQQVRSGRLSPKEALARIGEDLGPDVGSAFENFFSSVFEEIESLTARLDEGLNGVKAGFMDAAQRMHFDAITSHHEDFYDIASSPEFMEWVQSLPGVEYVHAQRVIEQGTAREIVKLLSHFKKAQQEAPVQAGYGAHAGYAGRAEDAAEGVRSSGVRLPQRPDYNQSYEQAWEIA